jgi:hypothetical protein
MISRAKKDAQGYCFTLSADSNGEADCPAEGWLLGNLLLC